MSIGTGTYAYFWRMSERVASPWSLQDALRDTADHGLDLFQICDHQPLSEADDGRLSEIAALATDLGITLELGTRGLAEDHLLRYLRIAERLGARLIRSMWTAGDDRPGAVEAERRLRAVLPAFTDAGVTLALETYEQVSTVDLVGLIERIDSPQLGICLDPGNTVANFEQPDEVTRRCAPYVKNWHVKDFDFTRSPGWVGFSYTGVPIGTGRLDYDGIRAAIEPDRRGINQIIEFWLPWQDSPHATVDTEARWTADTIAYLRSKQA
ncbi:sugar phosphate isomerase/epimerase family protein [Microlunatus soli]|uniref:Sugar phosphate isomerase/epimerase n=1 Tax=Microlunatus soli TaxID=630515 RepID=A0A1H1MSP8_9ACTN|nr:sugar phosphate isomerase/epimerase family protein [Microlunatus soli]SDR89395.1 Sugar phosphate isomerase/epimerase [Microlunatus soli]